MHVTNKQSKSRLFLPQATAKENTMAETTRPSRLPFPLLCLGCGVLIVVAALLILWLLHAIARAQKSQHDQSDRVCSLAQRAVTLLDDPSRSIASVHAARTAANAAVKDMRRFNIDPSQCQLSRPRTNDLFALQQEALSATASSVAGGEPKLGSLDPPSASSAGLQAKSRWASS